MGDVERCKLCGLPRPLNRKLVWTRNGGLYLRNRRSERLVFLSEEEIDAVMREGVRLRGEEVLDTLCEVRRGFTRERVASQMGRVRGFFMRHRPLARRVIADAFREAAYYGCGNVEVSRLKPGKEITVTARRPYHPHLLAGDIWGFWEGFFGVEALFSLEKVSETEWSITVRTVGKRKTGPGGEPLPRRPERDYDLDVCEKCRLPSFTYELRWDPDLGTIYHPGTHRHLVITSVEGWERVIGEINGSRAGELPPGMREALEASAAREYASQGGGNYKTAYRNFFLGLPLLGWGKPRRVMRKPFLMEAQIEDVPFPQLLACRIAGVFRALEKEAAEIDCSREGDNAWRYAVGPRLEGSFLAPSSLFRGDMLRSHPGIFLPF
ncbi:MAG: hypothetical protein H5T73_05825 [Actinobacteria bacterium]|nr:hypothetical protein [Actinomycetota bacterium]